MNTCQHTDEPTWSLHDAQGIYVCQVCQVCEDDVKSGKTGYRPDIFTDGQYWADEPIEPED